MQATATKQQQQPTLLTLSEQLGRVERLALIGAKPVLDLDEALLFTGLSRGQMYRLTSGRFIPHYKKNRKLYFKKTELEAWLLETRIPTAAETDSLADTYIVTHKK